MCHSVISVDVCTHLCHHCKRKGIATVGWADFEVSPSLSPCLASTRGDLKRLVFSWAIFTYVCINYDSRHTCWQFSYWPFQFRLELLFNWSQGGWAAVGHFIKPDRHIKYYHIYQRGRGMGISSLLTSAASTGRCPSSWTEVTPCTERALRWRGFIGP